MFHRYVNVYQRESLRLKFPHGVFQSHGLSTAELHVAMEVLQTIQGDTLDAQEATTFLGSVFGLAFGWSSFHDFLFFFDSKIMIWHFRS